MWRKAVRAISGEAQPSVGEMNGCYQAVQGKPLEELQASEAKYRRLLDDINDGCIVVNLEGKIVFANAKMAKILGYKLEELIGETARKFTPSEFIPHIGEIRQSLEQRRRVREHFEVTLLNMDGNRVSVEVSAKFIEYEGEPAVTAVVRDVTKRKEAEEALQESEKKYSSLVELSADGIVLVQGGEIIFANRSFYELLGFEKSEIIGIDILSLISRDMVDAVSVMSWDERQMIIRRVSDEMKGHHTHHIYQVPLKAKSGETVWVEIHSSPIEYEGKAAHLAFLRDITERKRAEESLRESEELTRGMLESAATGIYIVQGGKFQYVSPLFEEISGYTSEELIGTYSLGYVHSEDREAARERAIANLKGESRSPYEFRFIRKDEGSVWVLEKVASIKYKGERATVGSFMDITERKQAEEALLRHTERIAVTAELTRIITSSLNIEDVYEAFADGVKRLVDFDRFSIVLVEGDRARLVAVVSAVETELRTGVIVPLEGSAAEWVVETKRTNIETDFAQERQFPADEAHLRSGLRSAIRLPLFSRGEAIGTFNLSSRRPNAYGEREQEVLEELAGRIAVAIENAQLFEEARARVEELKAAQEYLVQTERQRALAEMAGGVAHDFNNVLSVVLGRAQLALEDVKEPKLKKSLQVIEQSAYDAANMVRRLQEFTGATVGEKLETLDLNQVVKSALKMVETRRAENQVNGVKIDIDADLGEVYIVEGNPAELRGVLVNIIFNAMDALPQGGRIAVKTAREDSWVLLSISDTGTGMTEEVEKRIFDPFFTTKGSRGSGLGLSASHGIISKHGGSIEVDSTLGKGSTFYIRLPIFNGTRRKAREG